MNKEVRLDKFLADAGEGTRSEVKKKIRSGAVTVNGETARRPEQKIGAGDTVSCGGRAIRRAAENLYYLMNKPAGVISATEDGRERTVLDLLPEDLLGLTPARKQKLFPVGRLDKDTEGLLLITDDGAVAHELLSPGKHVDKTYFARLDGELCDDAETRFAEGMDIGDDRKTLPAVLKRTGPREAEITLREGRFHQVKRMCAACGAQVLYLKRLCMGPLTLGDLKTGDVRPLTEEETQALKGDNR